MRIILPKTIILAIATLLLAVAALVTDLVSPYAGGVDRANSPAQVQMPDHSPYRVPVRVEVRALAANPTVSTPVSNTL
jgi:hypothetical protein